LPKSQMSTARASHSTCLSCPCHLHSHQHRPQRAKKRSRPTLHFHISYSHPGSRATRLSRLVTTPWQSDTTPLLPSRTPRSQPSFLTAQLPISNSQSKSSAAFERQSLHCISAHRRNEDAERDCTTVLGLSNKNVKALFRRAQARTALRKLGEAHNGV
jgi:hypothetical protein